MGDDQGIDRRLFERIAHPPEALVAPWTEGERPARNDFQAIRCKDASLCGFAYYYPKRPEYDQIVVTFGPPSHQFSVIAKIVHATPERVDGKDVFTIGCRIVERIDNPCRDEQGPS